MGIQCDPSCATTKMTTRLLKGENTPGSNQQTSLPLKLKQEETQSLPQIPFMQNTECLTSKQVPLRLVIFGEDSWVGDHHHVDKWGPHAPPGT